MEGYGLYIAKDSGQGHGSRGYARSVCLEGVVPSVASKATFTPKRLRTGKNPAPSGESGQANASALTDQAVPCCWIKPASPVYTSRGPLGVAGLWGQRTVRQSFQTPTGSRQAMHTI